MSWLDWGLVGALLAFMISIVVISKSYMRSVADFLSGGRTAGRYILCVSSGVAGVGTISIVGLFEMNYIAGFSMTWWNFTMGVVLLILTVSGWVVYRFRQTRAMTMSQFFEMRYSKRFRIFTGILAFISGIINFGIFPGVSARFFIYFCGLPQTISFMGLEASTFAILMMVLLLISLLFVFSGGQVTIIITEFVQGLFVTIVFTIVILVLLGKFQWTQIGEALQTAPDNASLINPYHTSHVKDFNYWYFLIGVFGAFYGMLSWQGQQGYNSSAKSAHEAKMAGVLSNWRGVPLNLLLLFVPIVAYTVMHHPDFLTQSDSVNAITNGLDSSTMRSQLTVPLALTRLLPTGIMGAFTAAMLALFFTVHATYLHSWGSILIQDVIMPFRRKQVTPEQHIRLLRLAIIGVALFIYCFSLFFRQTEYIFLFFAITGAIYTGGSGAVIIGGLYWKRGTPAAAWTAMITGSIIAVGGIIIHQLKEDFFINGQVFWFIAMVSAGLTYIAVSLLSKKREFNMDKLLHRGQYAIIEEIQIVNPEPVRGLKILGMGKEFTRGDRMIYMMTYAWTFLWILVFIIGTIYNLTSNVPDAVWMKFWRIYLLIHIVIAVGSIIWFTIGGLGDLKYMLHKLKIMERDQKDDGSVK